MGLYDTWHDGRLWNGGRYPRVLEELPRAFAHYDQDDIWRVLLVTMDLFRWLVRETAERLGYLYPTLSDGQATGLVGRLLSAKTPTDTHKGA